MHHEVFVISTIFTYTVHVKSITVEYYVYLHAYMHGVQRVKILLKLRKVIFTLDNKIIIPSMQVNMAMNDPAKAMHVIYE